MSRISIFDWSEKKNNIFSKLLVRVQNRFQLSTCSIFIKLRGFSEEILRILLGLQLLEYFTFSYKTTAKRAIIDW